MIKTITSRALWHITDSESEVRTQHWNATRGERIVDSSYSLISMGTECLVANGDVPPDQFAQMKVPYMSGSFALPVKYGYSLTGIVRETGERIHVMHPHQDICVVRNGDFSIIPDEVPLRRAILASNMETAVNAVWDGRVSDGQKVAIVGFGMIGALVATVLQDIAEVDVRIVDVDPVRQSIAAELGFTVMQPDHQNRNTFDIAFHTSATNTGLQTSIDIVGQDCAVIDMSWYGSKEVTLRLGGDFHSMRKRIISSQVSSIPPHMRDEYDFRRRKELVFRLLKNDKYDRFLTHELTLQEAANDFGSWRSSKPKGLGYFIKY